MVSDTVTDRQDYADFFIVAILKNVMYWQKYPAVQSLEVDGLDREREGFVRAIIYGLRVAEAWAGVCQLIETLSPYMERRGHWTVWQQVLDQAFDQAQRRDDTVKGAILALLLARLSQKQSKIKETIHCYRHAMRLARRAGDRYNRGRACTNLAFLYIEQGRWQRAKLLCHCALTIFEKENNLHGLAHTENHLGILYLRMGQWIEDERVWSKARPHLEQACRYWQIRDDVHGLMYGYMNLGIYYFLTESPQKSLEFSKKALDCAEQVGEQLLRGSISVNIGLAYQLQQDYARAEEYSLQAEKIFRQFYNSYEMANVQKNLGEIFLRQQKFPEASHYLHLALQNWRELDQKYLLAETMLYLCECEQAKNNYLEAEKWLRQAEALLLKEARLSQRVKAHLEKTRRSLA